MTDERTPTGLALAMLPFLQRLSEQGAQRVWKPLLTDKPVMLALFTRTTDADAFGHQVSVLLQAEAVFGQFPRALWQIGGPGYMLERLARCVGSQRGAGDETGVPHRDDFELSGLAMLVRQRWEGEDESDATPTLFAVDLAENVYRRFDADQDDSVTEWCYPDYENLPEKDDRDGWAAWRDANAPIETTHSDLARLLAACRMPQELAKSIFGPPAGEQPEAGNAAREMTAASELLAAFGLLNPLDPRHPSRAN